MAESGHVRNCRAALNGNVGGGIFRRTKIRPLRHAQATTHIVSCNMGCAIVEGIFWASTTWIGGKYVADRAEQSKAEWLLTAPDK